VNIIKNLLRMEKILDLFEVKNMERMVLKSFAAEGLSQNTLGDVGLTSEIVEHVLRRIEKRCPEIMPVTIDIEKDEEESKYRIDVKSRHNGLERRTVIDYDLTESPSFEEIVSISRKIEAVGEPPFRVEMEDKVEEIPSFSGLVQMIMEHGRKKLAIQRYKGLGEMNAEQLWETTMNPENRQILQVAIEDAVKANEIFSTLMGDQVEPRREFIERNALNVVNLDY
jgi:DNA gyrase subunit B